MRYVNRKRILIVYLLLQIILVVFAVLSIFTKYNYAQPIAVIAGLNTGMIIKLIIDDSHYGK